jgi:hypothetical protein
VPSLRVNIHVLASHTPQGSKATTSPTRSGSRRRARAETKPQHALEPARSLELCVCVCGNCSTQSVWAPSRMHWAREGANSPPHACLHVGYPGWRTWPVWAAR